MEKCSCRHIYLYLQFFSMQHWLLHAQVFTGSHWLPDAHVCIENDTIVAVKEGPIPEAAGEVFDCAGLRLVPAFVDMQVYGAAGRLFAQQPDEESLAALADHHAHSGTSQCLVTIATQPLAVVHQCLRAVRQYLQQGGGGIVGLHLEGPFIHPLRRGAHVADWIQTPTIDDIHRLLEVADGCLKMITLAPECCSDEVLQILHDAGVLIAAGHSNASYDQALQFANRGVQVVTHLFNAMSQLHHREPGLPLAALLHTGLHASIIPDGVHVHYDMVQLAARQMGDRLFFITDAVTTCTQGVYQHTCQGHYYSLPNGTLSGSALSMLQAVKNGVAHAGLGLQDALRKASSIPASLLGIGSGIEAGAPAELVLLNDRLELVKRFGF